MKHVALFALTAVAAVAAASTALADPCAQLRGSRWVAYVERPGQLSVEFWDFSGGYTSAPVVSSLTTTPTPQTNEAKDYGRPVLNKFTGCKALPAGNRAELSAVWPGAVLYTVTVSTDGSSATIVGNPAYDGSKGFVGWAAKTPAK